MMRKIFFLFAFIFLAIATSPSFYTQIDDVLIDLADDVKHVDFTLFNQALDEYYYRKTTDQITHDSHISSDVSSDFVFVCNKVNLLFLDIRSKVVFFQRKPFVPLNGINTYLHLLHPF